MKSRIRLQSATLPGNSHDFFRMFRFMPIMMRTNTQQSTSKYHCRHLFLPPCSRKQPNSWQMRCMTWSSSTLVQWQKLAFVFIKMTVFFGDKTWFQKKDHGMQTWVIYHMLVVCFFFQAKSVVEMWPHFCPRCGLVASFAVNDFWKTNGLYKGNLEQCAIWKDIEPGSLGFHFLSPRCFESLLMPFVAPEDRIRMNKMGIQWDRYYIVYKNLPFSKELF